MIAFGSEAFWLNVTNAALGLALLALCIAVAGSVILEIVTSKHGRRSERKRRFPVGITLLALDFNVLSSLWQDSLHL